ncbi:MAG: radical SAM family heme chaperone HemW [Cytophagaceae bacterium]|nr:radical SAM family heme chaperone HemW [Gemmatimonadaceae bacterium]
MSARHLYVHVPFCARRCSYCDFAIAVRREVPWEGFAQGIADELRVRDLGGSAPLSTLYFGGGTPSRLGGEGVMRLVDVVRERFALDPGVEVTLEANPEDVGPEAVRAWRGAGINRVSLGVQSFDPAVLQWMHRVHSAEAAGDAVRVLRDEGIDELSLDLIYALPATVTRSWERDLDHALALAPQHLSCYGLTIEPRTPLGRWASRGEVVAANEEAYEHDFLATHAALSAAGYEHYEVSNYARPGHRAVHNSAYWAAVPYIGLGPSAHGFDGNERRWNRPEYAAWQAAVTRGEDPVEGREFLTAEQRSIETVYLGLRSDDGLALLPGDAAVIGRWCDVGWGAVYEERLRLTPLGWLRLDALAAALTDHRSRY